MCDCIKQTNKWLRANPDCNTLLDVPIVINLETGTTRPPMIKIAVTKLDATKKRKPMPIFPSYCPFCGEKYPRQEEVTDGDSN